MTSPEGVIFHVTTAQLEYMWRFGDRSNDGFVDILEMPRLHLWIKPESWTEGDRSQPLKGTGAAPGGRWS